MKVEQITTSSKEIVESINQLLPQLSDSSKVFTVESINDIINNPNIHLLAAVKNNSIIGILTLVSATLLSGTKGYIEDVVVDSNARGQGVGKALINEAVRIAQQLGLSKLELSSRPSRTSANILYQKMGFEKRNTNPYQKLI